MKNDDSIVKQHYNYIKSLPRLSQEEIVHLYNQEHIPITDIEIDLRKIQERVEELEEHIVEQKLLSILGAAEAQKYEKTKAELEQLRKQLSIKKNEISYKYFLTVEGKKFNNRKYPSVELRNKIVNGTIYLALYWAHIYYIKDDNEYEYDDLVQIASQALISAAHYYIPSDVATFNTYASKCIQNSLKREVYGKKKKKNKSFFADEEHRLEQLELYLKAEENKNKRYFTNTTSRQLLNKLNLEVSYFNKKKRYREEGSRIIRKFKKCTLDDVFERFLKIVKESKLNVLLTAEEKYDIDIYLNYNCISKGQKNYLKVKYYLDLYRYKLEMIKQYIDAEKELRDKDEELIDENIIKEMNSVIKTKNHEITELKKSGFFDSLWLQYKSLYHFYNEYYNQFGIDFFQSPEDKGSRQWEKDLIAESYDKEFYASASRCFELLKDIETQDVVLYIYNYGRDKEEKFVYNEEKLVYVIPYIPFEQLEDKAGFSDYLSYYGSLCSEYYNEFGILSKEKAIKRVTSIMEICQSKEHYVEAILRGRKNCVNFILKEKNEPILEYNRKIKVKEDLARLGKKYKRYINQNSLNSIKKDIQLLYFDDPELFDILIGNKRDKRTKPLSVEEEVIQNIFLEDYCDAVSNLSKLQQQILNLYYDEDGRHTLTIKQIAEELGVSTSVVRNEKVKAMRKLKNNPKLQSYNIQ